MKTVAYVGNKEHWSNCRYQPLTMPKVSKHPGQWNNNAFWCAAGLDKQQTIIDKQQTNRKKTSVNEWKLPQNLQM